MGREVASAYRRRIHPVSPISPFPSRTSSATNSSMESLPDHPDNLTPARKHHKLLKDGSEVWSKEVEKIFVDGASNLVTAPLHTALISPVRNRPPPLLAISLGHILARAQ